jgi:dipeptidyl aminopeptidase/acylaminoacyl peptidase
VPPPPQHAHVLGQSTLRRRLAGWVAALLAIGAAAARAETPELSIPEVPAAPKRLITIDDLIALRDIDTLSVSPDGNRFAILVHQADVKRNLYRTGWFVGSTTGGPMTIVGDGGEARLMVHPDGFIGGEVAGSVSRWSPDGKWIAYMLKRGREVQLWRSRSDGMVQQQISHSAADVRDFAWSKDGLALYFTAGTSRATFQARDDVGRLNGFALADFQRYGDIVYQATPTHPLETGLTVWAVGSDGAGEHQASSAEQQDFVAAQREQFGALAGGTEVRFNLSAAGTPPVVRRDGALAWLARADKTDKGVLPRLRLTASFSPNGSSPISCKAPECIGPKFNKIWWSEHGEQVIFWRDEGVNQTEDAFYAWMPSTGELTTILKSSEAKFKGCDLRGHKLTCLRETTTQPLHVVSIDVQLGSIRVLADVNPEFKNLRFGPVERIEWKLPADVADLYSSNWARGFIIYPPDFNPRKKYPVFISPYQTGGFFRGDVGDEHPLLAYAANGIVVLNSESPFFWGLIERYRPYLGRAYSVKRGFPHMRALRDSTVHALELVEARGFVDRDRVGIGSISQGSMIVMSVLQKYNRIAAASVAQAGFEPTEYYLQTTAGREQYERRWGRGDSFPPDPDTPGGRETWPVMDIAANAHTIHTPIVFNVSDREGVFFLPRLTRKLDDAHIPYDAYVFPDERHTKWQPAHRYAIYKRNLDWFRFWLQGHEAPGPDKAEQYERWQGLCDLEIANNPGRPIFCVPSKNVPAYGRGAVPMSHIPP